MPWEDLNPVHRKGQMAASADGYKCKGRTWALVALSLLAQLPARVWQLLTVHHTLYSYTVP